MKEVSTLGETLEQQQLRRDSDIRPVQDQLRTIEETAEYLRTTPSTMRYWQQIGKGPKSFKLGVRRLWKQSDLDAWINEQYEAQTREAA
ncbi:helix-turn-helix transcriptional regulator [Nesterenkonia natronophila]|uniref:DNA-binding protein n=1 Tax=Nesterenkonia natronophila TaxID=2174932 RepID=A0A3A4F4B7_9MICC|nr:helix-turn-helix domain-containing protein [Nesterenkonia natronophila]RJN32913.1 DNA-binding protein [Nesterenkonia natronophila]